MLIKYVAFDEGMWETSVKERHATKTREGVGSALKRDLRDDRGVVERNDAAEETGAVFDSAREGSTPGATAKAPGLLSAGESEKQVENSEGGPGQARARATGLGGAGES